MRIIISATSFAIIAISSFAAFAATPAFYDFAPTPPMGWNSWDCFGAGVTEEQALANADYIEKNLKSHGWSIVTIDIQWYEPLAHSDQYRANAVLEMDGNGRLLPAPNRFPSSKDSRSFKPIADLLHGKGLKFGLHLLRGIPRQAVAQNVPVLGTDLHASDIANTKSLCSWNTDMFGVDMSRKGAQEYYDSVFALLASWDVDFVKVDDLLSYPYHATELEAIRRAIDKSGRPMILSGSPSIPSLENAAHISSHANMWRISDDFWDNWPALYEQFARLRDWTAYRGPGHFPDADMLPLGNIRAWSSKNNWTHLTHDEQITLMTLWCIARSPLILGANLPKNDGFTLSLLTNDEVLAVDQHSANNRQILNDGSHIIWVANVPDSADKYLAMFNATPVPARRGTAQSRPTTAPRQAATVSVALSELGLTGACTVRDLWSQKEVGAVTDKISAAINSHGAVLYRVHPVTRAK
jgi:alpha-galactosidase